MKKGEIWLVELEDVQGHEQQGERPGIVLGEANNMIITVPLTTSIQCIAMSYTLVLEPTKENGLTDDSIALVFQLRSLDKSRFKNKIGEITKEQATAIDALILDLLRLNVTL